MSYFQNPFPSDYKGSWNLGDRQYAVSFECPKNAGRGDEFAIVWKDGLYDMSGNDAAGNPRNTLVIWFAIDAGTFKNWASVSINVAAGAVSASAVTPAEIVDNLNNNDTFASFFTATLEKFDNGEDRISIRQKLPCTRLKFYVQNGRAEEALGFNVRAGIAELPTYFSRHTIANRFAFTDSVGLLIQLDAANAVDADLINNAVDARGNSLGYSSGTVRADWELLAGRSGLFLFRKQTVDGSDRPTVVIEYHAGSKVGALAKRITYTYSGANQTPTNHTEEPYTLQSGDLITPV